MISNTITAFNPVAFLASAGVGRQIELKPTENFFSQGDPADSVYYLQRGSAKLTVVSKVGKEATITLLSVRDFVGEEALAAFAGLRLATATAVTQCTALKIMRDEMLRAIHEEHAFSDLFLSFLLARSMRIQADLVDQLFNSSEKRLARILLLMAEYWQAGRARESDSADHAGDAGRNDWPHAIPRQLLYEPLPQVRLDRIQRPHSRAQILAKRDPA